MDSLFKNKNLRKNSSDSVPKLQTFARAVQIATRSKKEKIEITPMTLLSERVLYARKSSKPVVIGGNPITEETAKKLRIIMFGTATSPTRGEWVRSGFTFREPDKTWAFCLKNQRNSTRGLITVVQAEIIRFLLFGISVKRDQPDKLLTINSNQQVEALVTALSTIIWRIGEKKSATLCLPQEKTYAFQSMEYFQDGYTEKFMEDTGPGPLLLIYSALITRTLPKIIKDMEGSKGQLIGAEDEGSLCVVTLLLTGRATPYLHNGVVYVGDEDHYAIAQFGILSRSEVGFLVYNDNTEEDESKLPGSRLKTPSLPVWVILTFGHFGILYNTNKELLHNYHAERRFDLTYVTCGGNHALLTVDTRQSGIPSRNDEAIVGQIEKVIHSKWPDALIIWHGHPSTT